MEKSLDSPEVKTKIPIDILKKAYQLMCTAKSITELFEMVLIHGDEKAI